MYVTENDPLVNKLVNLAYPDFKGKKISIEVVDTPINCASYWDNGYRDYFVFINLADMKSTGEMPPQSPYDPVVQGLNAVVLKEGIVCVKRSYAGLREYVTILMHPDNANKVRRVSPPSLTQNELIVLLATCSLKSSYGGISNYRFHEAKAKTGITAEKWAEACNSLIAKKLLQKNSAISLEGRNALEASGKRFAHLWDFKAEI